jgi:queuosine precursor transporter
MATKGKSFKYLDWIVINTALFYVIGLYGIIPDHLLIESVLTGWFLKTLVETIATPATYIVVNTLKKAESEDFYDKTTNFSPFIFS